ncbi:MAG: tRNA (adenosine(37)-N6)-threonylcarbamoyltransferase complex ATPase subunit type 1 TsaE [Candidatus Magasanikbacteria bacterium]|nr:tRNA (adenosine(37)-N6)-threonylcarbamoyltransferase complex ATPase subunit type 1 TsaE [Candidatus Magasanikbacteria bacterium]
MEYKSKSEKETLKIGEKIAADLKPGDIVLLQGELGVGKTTLTKGILGYFRIKNIVSPTFTIMQIYQIAQSAQQPIRTLVHIDTYRSEDEQELIDIGIKDYLGKKNNICIIEWPEKIDNLIKNQFNYLRIIITDIGAGQRKINVEQSPKQNL